MNKFFSDLGAGLAWIWITPDEARKMLQQSETRRDVTFEVRDAQGAYAQAA